MPYEVVKSKGKLLRSLVITFIALKYFIFYRFTSFRKKLLGERLRLACQELGITFIKAGQLLSGRYDLLPEKDLQELKKLLDQVDPMPDAAARQIINQELGNKAGALSNLTLLSSASVAQVYASTLEGKPVVVKVLRPEVRIQAETDLAILYRLVLIAQKIYPTMKRLKAAQAVAEMRAWIREETDLSIELNNMERFRSHLSGTFPRGKVKNELGEMIVPLGYPNLSTPKVLVMERLNGVTVSDWLRGVRPANEKLYDPWVSLMTLFVGSLKPIFEGKGCPFHGDPHPANIIFLENGNVGLIDFGLMGQYNEKIIRAANKLYFAIYLKNAELAARALLKFSQIDEKYYQKILPDMRSYVEQSEQKGFGEWLKGTVQILRKHKLSSPDLSKNQTPSLNTAIMVKFVLLVDSMAHDFFPDKSTVDLLGPELESGIVAQIVHNLKKTDPANISLGVAYSLSEIAAQRPKIVGKVFEDFL